MSDNDEFKLQVTRVFARLYQNHPTAITLASDDLWEPPLTQKDNDYTKKAALSGGTLTWLYRNNIVSGEFHETNNGGGYVAGAQLTAHAYRIATHAEDNYGAIPLGQVAVEAMADLSSPGAGKAIDWVSRRFLGN